LNRGCFEAVLMKNTPRTLGVKSRFIRTYHFFSLTFLKSWRWQVKNPILYSN
jgi:hypothetical protein